MEPRIVELQTGRTAEQLQLLAEQLKLLKTANDTFEQYIKNLPEAAQSKFSAIQRYLADVIAAAAQMETLSDKEKFILQNELDNLPAVLFNFLLPAIWPHYAYEAQQVGYKNSAGFNAIIEACNALKIDSPRLLSCLDSMAGEKLDREGESAIVARSETVFKLWPAPQRTAQISLQHVYNRLPRPKTVPAGTSLESLNKQQEFEVNVARIIETYEYCKLRSANQEDLGINPAICYQVTEQFQELIKACPAPGADYKGPTQKDLLPLITIHAQQLLQTDAKIQLQKRLVDQNTSQIPAKKLAKVIHAPCHNPRLVVTRALVIIDEISDEKQRLDALDSLFKSARNKFHTWYGKPKPEWRELIGLLKAIDHQDLLAMAQGKKLQQQHVKVLAKSALPQPVRDAIYMPCTDAQSVVDRTLMIFKNVSDDTERDALLTTLLQAARQKFFTFYGQPKAEWHTLLRGLEHIKTQYRRPEPSNIASSLEKVKTVVAPKPLASEPWLSSTALRMNEDELLNRVLDLAGRIRVKITNKKTLKLSSSGMEDVIYSSCKTPLYTLARAYFLVVAIDDPKKREKALKNLMSSAKISFSTWYGKPEAEWHALITMARNLNNPDILKALGITPAQASASLSVPAATPAHTMKKRPSLLSSLDQPESTATAEQKRKASWLTSLLFGGSSLNKEPPLTPKPDAVATVLWDSKSPSNFAGSPRARHCATITSPRSARGETPAC